MEEAVIFDKDANRFPESYGTLRFRESGPFPSHRHLVEDLKDVITHLDIYRPRSGPLGPWKPRRIYRRGLTEKQFGFETVLRGAIGRMELYDTVDFSGQYLARYQAILDKENALHLDFFALQKCS